MRKQIGNGKYSSSPALRLLHILIRRGIHSENPPNHFGHQRDVNLSTFCLPRDSGESAASGLCARPFCTPGGLVFTLDVKFWQGVGCLLPSGTPHSPRRAFLADQETHCTLVTMQGPGKAQLIIFKAVPTAMPAQPVREVRSHTVQDIRSRFSLSPGGRD